MDVKRPHKEDVQPIHSERNSTGYEGVSKKGCNRFVANVKLNGKTQSPGSYDTAFKAALAYAKARMKMEFKGKQQVQEE